LDSLLVNLPSIDSISRSASCSFQENFASASLVNTATTTEKNQRHASLEFPPPREPPVSSSQRVPLHAIHRGKCTPRAGSPNPRPPAEIRIWLVPQSRAENRGTFLNCRERRVSPSPLHMWASGAMLLLPRRVRDFEHTSSPQKCAPEEKYARQIHAPPAVADSARFK
jgi:hypothetical protein